MDRLWPAVDDADAARDVVESAARFTTIWAVINLVIGLISLFSGSTVTERNRVEFQGMVMDNGGNAIPAASFIITGLVFALVSWKMRAMSRGWTVAGLILAAFTLLADLAAYPSPIAVVAHLVVLVYFINAVRAALAFERTQNERPVQQL
jgi:hypothetical protein